MHQNIYIMLYVNLLFTLWLYVQTAYFHFNVSEEVCKHMKAHTMNKTVLILKVLLGSNLAYCFRQHGCPPGFNYSLFVKPWFSSQVTTQMTALPGQILASLSSLWGQKGGITAENNPVFRHHTKPKLILWLKTNLKTWLQLLGLTDTIVNGVTCIHCSNSSMLLHHVWTGVFRFAAENLWGILEVPQLSYDCDV